MFKSIQVSACDVFSDVSVMFSEIAPPSQTAFHLPPIGTPGGSPGGPSPFPPPPPPPSPLSPPPPPPIGPGGRQPVNIG